MLRTEQIPEREEFTVESLLSKAAALRRKQSRPGSSRIALLTDVKGRAAPSAANPSIARFSLSAGKGRAAPSAANPSPAPPRGSSSKSPSARSPYS